MVEATLEDHTRPPAGQVAGRFFCGRPELAPAERAALLGRLGELDERLGGAGSVPSPRWRLRGVAALAPLAGAGVAELRRQWLDLAADLDEAADVAGADGLVGEAAAMAAVAERLLCVLLGVEDAPGESAQEAGSLVSARHGGAGEV